MAGGVALNAVANGHLLDRRIFKEIWVQPAASDAGCSLGIPFYIWHEVLGQPRCFVMEHAYWGPEYSEPEMQQAIARGGLSARRLDDVEAETARLLADGRVVGWFQGRMEWGSRALGNRRLLGEFKALTGVPVLLNTSFNVKGEPIVCTPDDAVSCFLKTELDSLVLGNYICTR